LIVHALWSHWSIASLQAEEARQLGLAVRSAPALRALIAVPLLLWAIHCSNRQLLRTIRKHWLVFSLAAAGVCAIVGSAFWLLLEDAYQWGAQDSVVAAILLVPVTMLCIGFAGCAVAARFDGRAGSR
jgi:drug/metabolite transporter (DMT)-like permease